MSFTGECFLPEHGGKNLQHFIISLMPHGGTEVDHGVLKVVLAADQRRKEMSVRKSVR